MMNWREFLSNYQNNRGALQLPEKPEQELRNLFENSSTMLGLRYGRSMTIIGYTEVVNQLAADAAQATAEEVEAAAIDGPTQSHKQLNKHSSAFASSSSSAAAAAPTPTMMIKGKKRSREECE